MSGPKEMTVAEYKAQVDARYAAAREPLPKPKVEPWRLPGVAFEIDGEYVPASECTWEWTAPCGCACAWHLVMEGATSADEAWLSSYSNARIVEQKKAQGFSLRMIRHKESRIGEGQCKHDPIWGVAPRPQPEGMTWAGRQSGRAKVQHIFPVEIDEDANGVGHDEVTSVCGRDTSPLYLLTTNRGWTDDLVECRHCWDKAAQS